VNRGAGPLLYNDIAEDFQVRTRSGADIRCSVSTWGNGGWVSRQGTSEPTYLPPGASGEIRVRAETNNRSTRDDPAAVSFRGETVELR
jgi:hypothetical protein